MSIAEMNHANRGRSKPQRTKPARDASSRRVLQEGQGEESHTGGSGETTLALTLGDWPDGANDGMLHLDVVLTREQAMALRRLMVHLKGTKEECSTPRFNRRLIATPTDAMRWLLEQISRQSA